MRKKDVPSAVVINALIFFETDLESDDVLLLFGAGQVDAAEFAFAEGPADLEISEFEMAAAEGIPVFAESRVD